MSEGFHPKPRISFPSALAVGIAGMNEVLELELSAPLTAEEVGARLAPHALPGLCLTEIAVVPPGSKKARLHSAEYCIAVPPSRQAGLSDRAQRLRSAESWLIHRPNRSTPVDLRCVVLELTFVPPELRMRLDAGPDAGAGVRDVLAALELGDLERQGACLVRTAVELHP